MKNIICSFFLIALCIIPYSCKKKGADPDPIRPPIDTIPKVDTNYLHFLRDTLDPILGLVVDSNYFLKNKPLDTIRKYINGKWHLRFIFGGFASEHFYPEHNFVEFITNTASNQDSIKFYRDISSDYTIKRLFWYKRLITSTDSSYVFNYQSGGVSIDNIVTVLRNDSLITQKNSTESYLSLFTKVH